MPTEPESDLLSVSGWHSCPDFDGGARLSVVTRARPRDDAMCPPPRGAVFSPAPEPEVPETGSPPREASTSCLSVERCERLPMSGAVGKRPLVNGVELSRLVSLPSSGIKPLASS